MSSGNVSRAFGSKIWRLEWRPRAGLKRFRAECHYLVDAQIDRATIKQIREDTTMTDIEKQVMNRVSANADLEGAQDLVDAHLDDVTAGMYGRGFSLHIQFVLPW